MLGIRRAKRRVRSGIFMVEAGETFRVVELVTTNLVRLELTNGDRPCLLWSFVRSVSDPLKPSEGVRPLQSRTITTGQARPKEPPRRE